MDAFEQVTAAANSNPTPFVPIQESAKNPSRMDPKQKKIIIISVSIVVIAAILAIAIGTFWYLDYTRDDGLIYSNVYAFGINLGGMTPEEASAAIEEATGDTYSTKNLTIQLPDTTLILSPASTKVSLDVDALVEAAYGYGRSGSRWENTQARAQAALTSHELDTTNFIALNSDFIRQVLEQHAATIASQLKQTEYTVTGEVPDLNRVYEVALEDTSVEHMKLTIVKGTPYRSLNTAALMETILKAYTTNNFEEITFEYDVTEPDELDLEKLFTELSTAPVDAILDETTFDVTPEVLGYGFDQEDLATQLASLQPGQTLEYSFTFLPAEVTMDALEEYLFQDTLASVDTNHVWNPNRTTNLTLAANAINGTIIRPGEVFSFNAIVGERTAAKGYKPAAVYSGGSTVDQEGGGICQVASTIYYAALLADLEIVERTEHMYLVDYVPPGMDATIYWGSYDFKFRNNTSYPIRIDAGVYDGQVHVKLIGTETKDYYVKMTYEYTGGPHYGATKYEVYPEGNPEGYSDGEVIQTAYTGYSVNTYRNRYSKQTNELIESKFEDSSTFSKRDKIICIIGDPNAPTDADGRPIETTTEATEPPTTKATEPPTTEATEPPTTEAPTEAPTETNAPETTEAPPAE